jgi:hypothetical protein
MAATEHDGLKMTSAAKDMVLSALERDQLAGMKKQQLPRRRLAGIEVAVLWSLRIYLVFMVVVVIYKMLLAAH